MRRHYAIAVINGCAHNRSGKRRTGDHDRSLSYWLGPDVTIGPTTGHGSTYDVTEARTYASVGACERAFRRVRTDTTEWPFDTWSHRGLMVIVVDVTEQLVRCNYAAEHNRPADTAATSPLPRRSHRRLSLARPGA